MEHQCFVLLFMITGSLSQDWTMTEPPLVNGTVGREAVLPCSFTHPQQQAYSGNIIVKWLAKRSRAQTFFQCNIQNGTQGGSSNCSLPGSSLRFSIKGDPRKRDLSLLIRNLAFQDNGAYFCRVELGYDKYQQKHPTQLHVTATARILNLTWNSLPSGSDNGSLSCEAEGNPPPSIAWLSSAPEETLQRRDATQGGYQRSSSVRYYAHHQYTCRAENGLGRAERRFPPGASGLALALALGAALLLLLGVAGVLLRKRGALKLCNSGSRPQQTSKLYTEPGTALSEDQTGQCPIYANSSDMENRPPMDTQGGDMELELVYSIIQLQSTTPSLQRRLQASLQDEDVCYSAVKFS